MPDPFLSRQSRFTTRLLLVFVCLWIAIVFLVPGCDQPAPEQPDTTASDPTPETAPTPVTQAIRDAWNHYHIHGVDALAQPVACVNELKEQVTAFIRNTGEDALATARAQLDLCRNLYDISRVFVAANASTRQAMKKLHEQIGLPLEMPGYIDAVPGYPYSGIVNDTSVAISKEELLRQHGLTDITDVSLGFDVIEFLLWGEHRKNAETAPRPLADFIAKQTWDTADYELGLAELDIAEHPNNRRRRYLEIAVMILEEHLNQLATLWNKNTLPPLNLAEADDMQQRIKRTIRNRLSAPGAATNEQLLKTLLPLFIPSDDPENGADKLVAWLGLNNPEALGELNHPEKPITAKYPALATLFSVPMETPEQTAQK
ncbi:MAG: imelysin family protein [Ketobacteraceae bacterium]|nr:imelysin family protein [Ketobacteraceae bacterium]